MSAVIIYHSLGEYQQALEYHKQALNIAKKVDDRAAQGVAYGNLGSDYHTLGDYQQALE